MQVHALQGREGLDAMHVFLYCWQLHNQFGYTSCCNSNVNYLLSQTTHTSHMLVVLLYTQHYPFQSGQGAICMPAACSYCSKLVQVTFNLLLTYSSDKKRLLITPGWQTLD